MHRLFLARQYRRHVRGQPPRQAVRMPQQWPHVTVQIPLYNERYVAERAVRAAAAFDYPRDRFEVQVLDDSTDDTTRRLVPVVADLRRQGVCITHVRRQSRSGFKAGALAHGLQAARGDLVAVFDADFVPQPDFLTQVVGEFQRPDVGMVQARWEHINEGHSLLTRTQALQLDAHFTIEHGVRAARGLFFNFNGTAGVWRKQAIVDAGGWQADTLTEDLDLSYRAQLAGWRFVYRDDVGVPAELPVEVAAYRQQQQRWAQGGAQSARKLLPTIVRASLPPAVKREAVWHLLNHFAYPLLALVTSAGLSVGLLADLPLARWVLAADGALLTFAMLSLGYFYGVTARARGGTGWWRRILLIPATMILGAGIALGQTLAVARGLTGRRTPFRRTPKYRIAGNADESWRGAHYRLDAGAPAVLELFAGVALLAAAAAESMRGNVLPSGLVLLFAMGLIVVGGISLLQLTQSPATDRNS